MIDKASFLTHARFYWLKASLWLMLATVVIYAGWAPVGGRNGGTAVGYGLGTLGVLIILWLAWLGVRKRRFAARRFRPNPRAAQKAAADPQAVVRGWTSAHVYLGLSLLVIGTLHAGFQFGWNVHTLAYALMVIVVASGVYGAIAYAAYPSRMSAALAGDSPEALRRQIAEADEALERMATRLPDAFAEAVRLSLTRTRIGGGAATLLSGSSRGCATAKALAMAERRANAPDHGGDPAAVTDLIAALSRKARLCARLRTYNACKARMDVMLWIHVPVTVALIVALAAHVFIVFFYW